MFHDHFCLIGRSISLPLYLIDMRIKNALINGLLLLTTVLFFFGSIEAALRLTGIVKMKDYTPPIYEKNENPKISYQLKPNIREHAFRNTVVTNSLGFRSPEPNPAKPLIALVGDSITFGYGVADEETLAANLQKLLPAYDFQNAGVPGYNIRQEAALFQEKITPLTPEALVLIFYWHDEDLRTSFLDEEDVLRPEGWQRSERMCQPVTRGILALIPGQCFLDQKSAFFRGLIEFVNTRSAFRERDRLRGEQAEVPLDTPLDSTSLRSASLGATRGDTEMLDLATYERELRELSRIAPAKRLFVIWPDAADLQTQARSELRRVAESQGFTVLDLAEHFGNTMESLSWDYIHPSAKTIEVAAKNIADALRLLLP